MQLTTALKAVGGRSAVLALVLTAALGATAQASVTALTLDPTAQLSPGRLHAILTGAITCAPGDNPSLFGQVIQTKNKTSGSGFTTTVCDGTSHPYAVDVSTNGGFPFPFPSSGGPFKAGNAIAQVTASLCDPLTFNCVTKYVDGEIRLLK
ncbi:MAG TPA: hypothetical protein VGO80_23920 [Solirubrobacteraceae bacterium]|jgi:hypothetical protein|nr:hypothetical protein [Solirubrobacteraceae bacterium]